MCITMGALHVVIWWVTHEGLQPSVHPAESVAGAPTQRLVTELTELRQLAAEKDKVQKMVANVDDQGTVVLSVQKQEDGGESASAATPDSPGRSSTATENDLESITMSLIETKMALAHESSEKHELENQLQQTEKSNRALSTEISELKLKIGSLTASLKAAEIAARKK